MDYLINIIEDIKEETIPFVSDIIKGLGVGFPIQQHREILAYCTFNSLMSVTGDGLDYISHNTIEQGIKTFNKLTRSTVTTLFD